MSGLIVYRVVIKRFDHSGKFITEKAPWLPSEAEAANWAKELLRLGYVVTIEDMQGSIVDF